MLLNDRIIYIHFLLIYLFGVFLSCHHWKLDDVLLITIVYNVRSIISEAVLI